MSDPRLEGKVALVTGAGGGIGAAIAAAFARAGARVMLANRTRSAAEAAAATLRGEGYAAQATDFVADEAGAQRAVAESAAAFGALDILVHNAGGCTWSRIETLDAATLDATLTLNLKCCFWLAQAALPLLRARGGGRILVTSSVTGPRAAMVGAAHYAAAKAGVNGFIRSAALEFAADHITVNGVEPGFIAKDHGRISEPQTRARIERFIPLGCMGEPDDIAQAMLYLASDAARWVTGQTLVVDGGATLPETGYAMESQWPGARGQGPGANDVGQSEVMTNILIIGTADTKAAELQFLQRCIQEQGGRAQIMDVGVLGTPPFAPSHRNTDVAKAAGTTLEAIIALGDENAAMTKMAAGAVALALQHYAQGTVQGVLALGGTMGTDLALDVTAALPLGMPKLIVSTVAYSHLFPPERLAPDLMMVLWAGGLYGLNSICRSILRQAAGAVLGAARAADASHAIGTDTHSERPAVAIGSLGLSCLRYMAELKPALEARGYEVVVFHCSGMGGRAMEALIEQGRFAAVFDFALQEVANQVCGSVVNSGATRLTAAGRCGVPQLVAPGASDMIDMQTWAPLPPKYVGRPYHAHNRLIASVTSTGEERRAIARHIAARLAQASGPTAFLLPLQGIEAWDRPGEPLHDPEAHAALVDEFRRRIRPPVEFVELDLHINDAGFVSAALARFDTWVAAGRVPAGHASGKPPR